MRFMQIKFCREHLAGFKTPKKVVLGALPKTVTGKIQKNVTQQRIKDLAHKTMLLKVSARIDRGNQSEMKF